jgi:2-polyprenyl-6-methoxyphenol hydroxylase-like FAD-dependent oxidoreductase
MNNGQHVPILGGGIAGPTLALFLRRAGFKATIFEARQERSDIGAALGLAPNGMNVLAELGLADRVITAGTIMDRSVFRSVEGRPIGATPATGSRFGEPGVTLSRAALHRILVEAAAAAGIPVRYGQRLVDMREDARGVTAIFADGSEERGDLLVGADGINSRVRDLVLPDAPKPEFTGIVGPGGFMPRSAVPERPDDDGHSLVLYYSPRGFFGYGRGDRDEATGAFWWTVIERETPMTEAERDATSLADVRESILAASDHWDQAVRHILEATTKFVPPLNIFDVASLPRWWRGRTVLIGDAAHAVSPHSGQGASMALEDAIVLARILRDAQGSPGDAFAAFEAARRDRVERVVAFGRQSGNSKKKQGPLVAWVMRMAFPLLIRMVGRMQAKVYRYRLRWDEPAQPADGERRQAA